VIISRKSPGKVAEESIFERSPGTNSSEFSFEETAFLCEGNGESIPYRQNYIEIKPVLQTARLETAGKRGLT
jgi:hypothetical protein